MGSATRSDKYAEFARAFLTLAEKDLRRAEAALERKDWADTLFRTQQAVEKAVKALLEMHHFFESTHDLSKHFFEIIVQKEKEDTNTMNQILETLEWFAGKWQDTRYPHIAKGKVVLPEDVYGKEQAKEAFQRAHYVVDAILKVAKKKYALSL